MGISRAERQRGERGQATLVGCESLSCPYSVSGARGCACHLLWTLMELPPLRVDARADCCEAKRTKCAQCRVRDFRSQHHKKLAIAPYVQESWLDLNPETGRLFCRVCQATGTPCRLNDSGGPFNSKGLGMYNLDKHQMSKAHQAALATFLGCAPASAPAAADFLAVWDATCKGDRAGVGSLELGSASVVTRSSSAFMLRSWRRTLRF